MGLNENKMKVIKPGRIDKVFLKEHITCSNCEAILEFTELDKLRRFQNVGLMIYRTGLEYVICIECGHEIML
jgi:hypothetical protein